MKVPSISADFRGKAPTSSTTLTVTRDSSLTHAHRARRAQNDELIGGEQ